MLLANELSEVNQGGVKTYNPDRNGLLLYIQSQLASILAYATLTTTTDINRQKPYKPKLTSSKIL